MVPLTSLLLPILLSAVLVFVASFIINVMLPYHRTDYARLPAEDEVMAALRRFGLPPGDYVMPHTATPKVLGTPEYIEKSRQGPVALMTVAESGPPAMGKSLIQWFIYSLVVSLFAGYIASRALGPGADYMDVFRFAGTTAFVGYSLSLWQLSIWYKRKWSTTLKSTFDGLVYALLTAGAFGALWPS